VSSKKDELTILFRHNRILHFGTKLFVHDDKYFYMPLYCNDDERLPIEQDSNLIWKALDDIKIFPVKTVENVKESWEAGKAYHNSS
jgi:hypothetical protein